MTNLKDKLSASVRQAKATAQPVAKTTTPPAASKPVAAKPVAEKAAVARPDAAQPKAVVHGGIAFPDRVWPD